MAELQVAFRLPDAARVLFVSDYGLRAARLTVDGAEVLAAAAPEALAAGVSARLPGTLRTVTVRATDGSDVRVWVDGVEAVREDRLRAPTSRSAWAHAFLALSGSALGFIAGWLYLRRAAASADPWAMKMAVHMAAWHLFLTLTLFPASVWGQRIGIRAVQAAALVFFLIHVGIAVANVASPRADEGPWIALLNGSSGLAFLATVLYGQRAHADMNPLARR